MAEIKTGFVEDKDGNKFAPSTISSQVFDENGKSVKQSLTELNSSFVIGLKNKITDWIVVQPNSWGSVTISNDSPIVFYSVTPGCQQTARFYFETQATGNDIICRFYNTENTAIACRVLALYK